MRFICFFFFFFNDTATTEIYTLSLHDALPISVQRLVPVLVRRAPHHHSVLLERQGELRMKRPGDLALRALHGDRAPRDLRRDALGQRNRFPADARHAATRPPRATRRPRGRYGLRGPTSGPGASRGWPSRARSSRAGRT